MTEKRCCSKGECPRCRFASCWYKRAPKRWMLRAIQKSSLISQRKVFLPIRREGSVRDEAFWSI